MILDQIDLDIHRQDTYITINCKQYDKGSRSIDAALFDNGEIYNIPANCNVYLRCIKPDNTQCLLKAAYENNMVHVTLTDQVLATDGLAICDIGIYQNNDLLLSTSIFHLHIIKAAYDDKRIASSNEYAVLTEAIMNCEKVTKKCEEIMKTNNRNMIELEAKANRIINQLNDALHSITASNAADK